MPPQQPGAPGRPLRIAILGSRGIPAGYGGFETFVQELAPMLTAAGVETTVFCESPRDGQVVPARWKGVRLVHVSAAGPGPLGTLAYDLRCLWRARKDFDVVYMLGYGAAFACGLPRRSGAKVWINMDGLEWRRSKWGRVARTWLRWNEGQACRRADRLIFDSAALRREVELRRDLPRSSVIAYGTHPPVVEGAERKLEDLGLKSGRFLLAVCRFEPENQVVELVRARLASRTHLPLVLVTNIRKGPGEAEVRAASKESVRCLGPVYDPEVLGALRAHCAAYLHGHTVGGTNPSLLEAMGAGAYCIAHDNPYNRETLGETGAYFRGSRDLAARLDRLVGIAEEAGQTGRLAKRRADQHYHWDGIANAYLELLGVDRDGVAQERAA